MASTFTTNLKFNKPALGDAGWGTAVNGGFTDLADVAISGVETVNVTASDVTMTIDSGASGVNDARNMFIEVDGTMPANRVVTVPANSKLYFVFNNTTGAYTLDFENAGGGVEVPQGKRVPLYSDGAEVRYAFDHLGALTLGTALAAPSGGTGQSSYAVGDLLYAGTTTTLTKLAAAAVGNVLRAKGTGTAPAWEQVVLTTDVTGVLPAANGGTGLSSPGALGNVLRSDGAGAWTSSALASATDTAEGLVELATTAEIQTGTDTTRAITPAGLRNGALVRGTVQNTTSGTSIDFAPPSAGIPSWTKRITIMLEGVSTNGTSTLLIQIGDSGGIENTGYQSGANFSGGAGQFGTSTSGFLLEPTNMAAATFARHGIVTLVNVTGNLWVSASNVYSEGSQVVASGAGSKTLSGVLDRIRLTTTNGTDTFDAGSINIMYE